MMEKERALVAFASLSQKHRLQIVRLLVVAGPEGMAAGALSAKLGAASPKMSFHLSHLEQAGLITSRRDGRSIRYSIQVAALSGLIGFHLRDRCQGQLEICGPAMADLIQNTACAPTICEIVTCTVCPFLIAI